MSPFARAQVCGADLLSNLEFMETGPHTIVVKHRSPSRNIATIVRPARAYTFQQQALRVESWAALRSERTPEILSQIGPQFDFWSSVANLNPAYAPFSRELVAVALALASSVVQRVKLSLVVPRPADFSPRVQPMFDAPGFYAYPSGHATQAFMVARLLKVLTRPDGSDQGTTHDELSLQLARQAERIATNRVVAGIHYPIDSAAGCALGMALADYFIHRCDGSDWCERTFNGDAYPESEDFDPRPATENFTSSQGLTVAATPHRIGTSHPYEPHARRAQATPLGWLWCQAMKEWREPGMV